MYDDEIEHPDEMPADQREDDLEADELPVLPDDEELPRDAEVPQETIGA